MKNTNLLKFTSAAVLALSLVGCSSSSAATESSASSAASSAESTEPTEIIIAISPDYPPYDTVDTDGNLEGYDVDMGNWLFDYLNENGYNYEVTWTSMSFDTIISAIQADQVDLGISGFTYDEERKVLFSDPYYDSAEVVLVNADSEIETVADLNGKQVGAQLGSTGESCANEIEGAEVTALEDAGVLVASLKANSLDAVVMDKAVADNYVSSGDYKILDEVLLDEENYIIAKEGNTELMDVVNEAIAAYKESDAYTEIEQKWMAGDAE